MKTRILSAIVMLPVLIALVVIGGWPLQIFIGALGLIAMHEYYHAFSPENLWLHGISYFFAVIYIMFIHEISSKYFGIFVSLFLVVLLIYTVVRHAKTKPIDGMTGFFGFFYGCFLLSHIYLVREFTYGNIFIWLVFLSAFGCDTGAYFVGVTLGKHKLIPDLSPKKTIEGSIGGILTATILCLIYGYVIGKYFKMEDVNILLLCGMTGFIGSILAQIGDLAASAMKRMVGLKDFGRLIPGHGGVLDRFDSVILTAPAVYYLMFFLIRVQG